MRFKAIFLASFFLSTLFLSAIALAENPTPFVKIGVLSHRGDDITHKMWNPTANYLIAKLPQYDFEIVPLDFDEVELAVKNAVIDFVLVNPGIYVNLEAQYNVTRLATMINLRNGSPYSLFGGVIFTHSDRDDIQQLNDTKGKSFMAVDETSLGGFQMAWRELNAINIDPYHDFSRLEFGGIHDKVVNAVIEGNVDVGTVRTDILERMGNAGLIDMDDIKIINPQKSRKFPLAHSTQLYPEWPFSQLAHTQPKLARQVAVALFQMPKIDPALEAGKYAGWSIPLDYHEVHALFKQLKLAPYASLAQLTITEAVARYWYWVIGSMIALLALLGLTSFMVRHNSELKYEQLRLERRHQLINESVADGIYGVDLVGNCTFVNKATMDMTGWTEKDLIGKNQHLILHHTREDGSPFPRTDCPVHQSSFDNQPRFIADDIFWKKDGTYINVEYSCTPLRGLRGETRGSVVVFRDITERKQTQKHAEEHQSQLVHVGRLSTLGEMASGIAHELNQPLTAITTNARACIRLLETDINNAESCADVMEKIASQAERAGGIIQHIRHFAHKELPNIKPAKVKGMMDVVLDLVEREIKSKKIILTMDLDKNAQWVMAQDIQVEQVILNLVRNAIESLESMPVEKRKLMIKTTVRRKNKVEIRVTDTGRGLKKVIREQLFEPFMTTKDNGMGLGLSISQGIIEAHGSQIQVETPLGHTGVSFYFSLLQSSAKEVEEMKYA
ncbi:MAG: PhnD/SsuA/transferrin family substrate-binding protein [Cocleimonas sp.]|nr:PhnD/SsuA/transferrin family substrate-binding protein [Cocleimonas sp.]